VKKYTAPARPSATPRGLSSLAWPDFAAARLPGAVSTACHPARSPQRDATRQA